MAPTNVNFCIRDGDFPIVYVAADNGFYKYFPHSGLVLPFKAALEGQTGKMIGYGAMNVFVPPPPPIPGTFELIVPTNGSTNPGGVWHYVGGEWILKNSGLPPAINWTRAVASPVDPDTWVVYKQDQGSSEPCRMYWTNDAGASFHSIDPTSGMARFASLSVEIGYDNQIAALGEFITSGPTTINAYAFWGGIDGEPIVLSPTLTSQSNARSRFVGAAQPFPDGKIVWTAAAFYVFGRYYYTFGTAEPGNVEPIFGDWSGVTEEDDQPDKLRGRARFVDYFGEHWYGMMMYPMDANNENRFALYQSPNHALAPGPVTTFAPGFSSPATAFCILADGRAFFNQIDNAQSVAMAPNILAITGLSNLTPVADSVVNNYPIIGMRSDRQTRTMLVCFPQNQVKGYAIFDGVANIWSEIPRPAGGVSNGDIIVRAGEG